MCVIFLAFKTHPEYPLIVLANRDEFYDRPSAIAEYWDDFPGILAGRDLVGKGTWLGIEKTGRFSALTNYREPNPKKMGPSRGLLVSDFLKSDIGAKRYLKQIESKSELYSGFSLLVGEFNSKKQDLFYFSNRRPDVKRLDPGIYGLSNHLLDTPWRKVEKGKARFRDLLNRGRLPKEELFELLADRSPADDDQLPDTGIGYQKEKLLSSIFIETPVYGTRCSTILSFNKQFLADLEERVFVP